MPAAIIAHRGASAYAPENTLAAVRMAWEMDADAVEVDLHGTADGHAVVIHDPDTRRTTGTRLTVKDATLEQLQTLDAGSFKDPIWEGERIPSLGEVLATVPPGKRLVIELKAGPELLAPLGADLAAAFAAGMTPAQIVLIAFDRELALLAKARWPAVTVLWLYDPRRRGVARPRPTAAVRQAALRVRELGLDGLDLFAHRCVRPKLVEEIHALGLQVFVWTVNRPRAGERFLRAGVDGLTTNHPDTMRRLRERLLAGPPAQKE